MLVEEKFRPSLEPIRPMSQIDLVRIEFKYLLLGKSPLDLYGEKYLLNLAAIRLLRREKEVPRQLHRQSRGTLRPSIRVQIAIRRPYSTKQVHTPVALKALIFNRNN